MREHVLEVPRLNAQEHNFASIAPQDGLSERRQELPGRAEFAPICARSTRNFTDSRSEDAEMVKHRLASQALYAFNTAKTVRSVPAAANW